AGPPRAHGERNVTLDALLRTSARLHPERPALEQERTLLTYRELDRSTDRIAAGFLELGLDRGERVAILMPNRPTLVEALFGAFKAGLTAVPLNMRLHPREVEYIVRHSGAKAIVLDRELAGDVRPALAGLTSLRQLDPDDLPRAAHAVLPEPAASDPAWIFY